MILRFFVPSQFPTPKQRVGGGGPDCTGPINLPTGCFRQCVDQYYIYWIDVWQKEGYLVEC